MRSLPFTSVLLVLVFHMTGCGVGRVVQKGVRAYHAMNYHQAMSFWRELEPKETKMNEKGRVRYLVYRGLTHHRLGQQEAAIHFLRRGQAAYHQGDPRWLDPPAVQQMGRVLKEHGGAPAPPPEEPVDIR